MRRIGLVVLCVCWPTIGMAATPAVAVFPFQDLSHGRNDVNLPLTRYVAGQLADAGTELNSWDTVVAFMANNRIRNSGHLETFQISKVREDLGAAFILLGTITQRKEARQPCLGVTLALVRTSDARTVWSYAGDFSTAAARRILGLGEPDSVAALQPLLAEDILSRWPWDLIGPAQQFGPIGIQSVTLEPRRVRPGAEVVASVRVRRDWPEQRAPRAFFKADEQLHAAEFISPSNLYRASWIAGERDGRFPVTLVLEWPLYGRSEEALMGSYLVDATPPIPVLDLVGADELGDTPVFSQRLAIQPRLLVSEPLARWHFSIRNPSGIVVADLQDTGGLPERLYWWGQGRESSFEGVLADGVYDLVLKVWDVAGSAAETKRRVALNRSPPQVQMVVDRSQTERAVALEDEGKLPLAFWRMEMWSEEGRLLKTAEGTDLPARVGLAPGDEDADGKVRAILVVRDVLGTTVRKEIDDVFESEPKALPKPKQEEKPKGASRKWVDEF